MADPHIAHNRDAYDAIGGAYDGQHPEIFNPVEQERLRAAVARAASLVSPARPRPLRALDVGAGTGNVTAHLVAAGLHVTAADVSTGLLAEIRRRFAGSGALDGTLELNGTDLRQVPDGSFDVVVAYSVLHHVPDYLTLVREMARVTAPGGVVMIDHERTDESWTPGANDGFLRAAIVWPRRRWWFFLQPHRYWKRIRPLLEWRRWKDPRWMPEGDLHIWPDDHIEWAKVAAALEAGGCAVTVRDDYLAYEPRFLRSAWEEWRTKASDTRCLVARRAGPT